MVAESGWFAARPSGTEDIYKIYAESFRGEDHLRPHPGGGAGDRQRRSCGRGIAGKWLEDKNMIEPKNALDVALPPHAVASATIDVGVGSPVKP